MPTYLLTWNPEETPWSSFTRGVASWNVGHRKQIPVGSRFFMLRQRVEPRGIFASGYTTGDVYAEKHFRPEARRAGRKARFVPLEIDKISDSLRDPILHRHELDDGSPRGNALGHSILGYRDPGTGGSCGRTQVGDGDSPDTVGFPKQHRHQRGRGNAHGGEAIHSKARPPTPKSCDRGIERVLHCLWNGLRSGPRWRRPRRITPRSPRTVRAGEPHVNRRGSSE